MNNVYVRGLIRALWMRRELYGTKSAVCSQVRGQPLMIWGGGGGNRYKNFGGPSPGEKI